MTKSTFLAAFIPFALGFLIVGGLGFAAGAYGAVVTGLDELSTAASPTRPAALVLGGVAGLLGGIAGGFVAELLGRALLLPFFGAALWRMPLLVPSLFTDGDNVAGLRGWPNADLTEITLRFERHAAADAFLSANADARPHA